MKTAAYAASKAGAQLAPFSIDRREPGENDVVIDVLFCGVCHSDLHQVKDEWGGAKFPMVPGHEIVGRVSKVGGGVKKFAVGNLVGVGCMVDACHGCRQCEQHHEQFCEKGCAYTYNSTEMDRTTPTYGGYSKQVVVTESFVLKVPENLDPAAAAPLLCAGITTWSPLRQWGCKKGDRVGVVGLGGLGHMAVKLAASMGAEVTMLSTSKAKEADAKKLGATGFAVTKDPETFTKLAGHFDLIIDTISAEHDLGAHLGLLRPYGTMVLLGVPPSPAAVHAFSLIGGNKRLAGSLIGGIQETQEMLDYCGQHSIVSDVEVIPVSQVNACYERMLKGDVRYRFVLDLATI
ncbi:MAG: NAD(P)-dependent alcohol dehydrogenase [Polyangiaceae bacterium]|nr:NAD(P)-dependent alcohol dehydrogenase [Polyangiaceae bacterium]